MVIYVSGIWLAGAYVQTTELPKNGGLWRPSGVQPSPALYYYYRLNLEKNNRELRF